MDTLNIHEAKTHLSRIVERVSKGESVIIAKAGKEMVKIVGLNAPSPGQEKRLGFLDGRFEIPDDFNEMGAPEIEQLFDGFSG